MIRVILSLLTMAAVTGCASQGEEVTGSEMVSDENGRSTYVTYVTQEEFQRMTPEERERLHARVKSSSPLFPSKKKPSKLITEGDLEEIYAKEK